MFFHLHRLNIVVGHLSFKLLMNI